MSEVRNVRRILLVGAGELGRELALAAKALGLEVVAVDRYAGAPAMQVSDLSEVVDLFDGAALEGVIRTYAPDLIVPELETVRAKRLMNLAREGVPVIPTAEAVHLAASREGIRNLAALELGIPTPEYAFADSEDDLREAADRIGYPCVVKPVLSFSGRGQSVVGGPARIDRAWAFASDEGPGDLNRVLVEEFIEFDSEITLLTVAEGEGKVRHLPPIGHRQEQGDYRESWTPADVPQPALKQAQELARKVVTRLGGQGVYGVEFFVRGDDAIFSEISPGPHDTALVTLISQDLSQFEIHLRAALGLPLPQIRSCGPSASAVILAHKEGPVVGYGGVARALNIPTCQVRIFGKPHARRGRRMGVVLAGGETAEEARTRALEGAARVDVQVA